MVFRKEDTASAVRAAGRKVRDKRIIEQDGQRSRCCKCEKDLTLDNLGRILPGSMELYCDNPICFNEFSIGLL